MFLLSQLNEELDGTPLGIYRDDGLAISHGTPRQVEITKKKICNIFKKNKLKITIEANKKVINYLDVTLNLPTEKHQPYLKPGNIPQYINTKSNHPPMILKAVPEGINKRLSEISSDEQAFKNTTPIYQEALNRSGYNYTLQYKQYPKKTDENQQQRKRSRKITWFNPPFDLKVKTNVGKSFISIVETCFPEGHPLRKIFNRNTLKISYSCTPNIKSIIDNHNNAKLKNDTIQVNSCNCREKTKCPLNGACKQSKIVYQAKVQAEDATIEYYIGLTDTDFKARLANHKQSFNKNNLKNSTELSKYVWSLKDRNINYNITWKVLGKTSSYNNRSNKCNLCTLEKYFILCHPDKATLNQKSGLINSCRHSNKFLLANHPT